MTQKELPGEVAAEIERTACLERLKVFLASRAVGNELTLSALETGIQIHTILRAAADITRYADEALATVNDKYHPPLHCKEGCSYCCCKPGVLTSIPELLRILQYVESTFSVDAISDLRDRSLRYAHQVAGRNFNDPLKESVPCPLLVDGRCSVYEVRPLTCRGYNSMNVDACRKAHENPDVLVPVFTLLKDVTDGTTVGAAQALKATGFNDSLVDLGSALNIALATGDTFAETVIDGGSDLAPAENSSMIAELWTQVCEMAQQVGIDVNLSTHRK